MKGRYTAQNWLIVWCVVNNPVLIQCTSRLNLTTEINSLAAKCTNTTVPLVTYLNLRWPNWGTLNTTQSRGRPNLTFIPRSVPLLMRSLLWILTASVSHCGQLFFCWPFILSIPIRLIHSPLDGLLLLQLSSHLFERREVSVLIKYTYHQKM